MSGLTRTESGAVLGGRYRLERRVASGGMGTVWAAEDETLHRRVAVKALNEGLSSDERFAERFRREARAAAGLSHPNIANVFDFGEDEGRPYLVMELLSGETLADRLERGPLEPGETVRVGEAVAAALEHAHAAGIVHRDVKPANIMLTADDQVKVMDFGIAAPLEGATGLTATGNVMGTSRYISPEQAEGLRATPASDVYSLGVVLYETVAGEAPFVRQTPVATALAHMHEKPRPLSEARPDAPGELAAVIHACLAKEPASRPSPGELRDRLHAAALSREVDTAPVAAAVGATAVLTPPAGHERTEPIGLAVPLKPRHARPTPERRRRFLIGAAIVAVALIAFAAIASTLGSGEVKVPRFVGMYRAAAQEKADHLGLHPVFHWEASDEPRGKVIAQRPHAGAAVLDGAGIRLTVSEGPGEEPAPPQPREPDEGGDEPGHGHGKGHDKHGKEKD